MRANRFFELTPEGAEALETPRRILDALWRGVDFSLGREIFGLTRVVRRSPEIVTCRLVDEKITYVHRRLWPALAPASSAFYRRAAATPSSARCAA